MASLKNIKFSFSGAQRLVDERERKERERERRTEVTMRPNFYSNLSLSGCSFRRPVATLFLFAVDASASNS